MQRAATATRSTNDRSAFTVIECVAQAAAEVVARTQAAQAEAQAQAEAVAVETAPGPATGG